ncbi:MAG: branched-chain amino acid aminotransferase [Myxococcales bacterium]|nr:branched-chain amino acid aminotransferase [Myxococcales bacterium]USN51416.1 MAG: branched-chain amino acid aminotransferase [Myxococcales bacterium]
MKSHPASKNFFIERQLISKEKRKPAPGFDDEITFGRAHSNHMLTCDFLHDKGGWQTPRIIPFGAFSMQPDSVAFHYGQQIFEGLKAFRMENTNELALFRPQLNAQRFYDSALRLGMQPVPQELFIEGIKVLVSVDEDYLLAKPWSLYIRPCLIPLDCGVSYRASRDYRFFVILSAVKEYFSHHQCMSVYVEQEMARAFKGGIGNIKAGANYAGALLALKKAQQCGADSVLWLDANEHRYVEEIGAMNIVFVYQDRLVTPPLLGTILPGVTRDAVLKLAQHFDMKIVEEQTDIGELIDHIRQGVLKEAFGCGTAAAITPINQLILNEEKININDGVAGPVTVKLKKVLKEIQYGEVPDIFGWRTVVPIMDNN